MNASAPEGPAFRHPMLVLAVGPVLGMLLSLPFTADGAEGVFQAGLVALVLIAGLSAVLLRSVWPGTIGLIAACVAAASVHAIVSGSLTAALALGFLLLATGAAASGLATVGRTVGCPWLTAGGLAAAVLWIAMGSLFWVDAFGDALPREQRYAFKQSVMHLDLATAAAYDAAAFDRFHHKPIYRDIPIASSIVRAPSAWRAGLSWLAFGAALWVVALLLGRLFARRPEPA